MNIYHKELGFPQTLVIPNEIYSLSYTAHAEERRVREGKHGKLLVVPTFARISPDNVFEIYTEDNIKPAKASIRINYDFKNDMVLILEIMPDLRAKVITFWLNSKGDKHKNFNKDKYTPLCASVS